MPLREYVCKTCGRAFEVLERAGEKASCPECGSQRLEKQLSAFSARATSAGDAGCAAGCPVAEAGACGGHHHHGAGCGCGCH